MKTVSFFKGLSWLIVLNLVVKPVWIFAIDRKVQVMVGYEAYGSYFAMLNLSFVLLFVADAGLTNLLNQRLAHQSPVHPRQLLFVKCFLLLLYAFTAFLIAWISRITEWEIFVYIILVQALTSLFVFLRGTITARQYFTADAWFSVIDKTLMIIFCGSILYTGLFGNISIEVFLQVQLLCTAVAVASALFFIFRRQVMGSGQREAAISMARNMAPFALIILLMSVHYRIDGFLLERMHPRGPGEAGIYAAAYRLLDAGNMIGFLAASFLVPFIARHRNDLPSVREVVLKTRHGLLVFAIGLSGFAVAFAPWIERLLYHNGLAYNALVLQCTIAVLPAYYLVHVYGSILTATSRFRLFISILSVGAALNLVLNIWLIPLYGALGCSIAALASQYISGLLLLITAGKKAGIPYQPGSVLLYVLQLGVLSLLFYGGILADINVWIILAIAVCISLLFLTVHTGLMKKYFVSLR
jgi:O-antigen/teichoic acid export membrane protein